jgi:hypothetical protein
LFATIPGERKLALHEGRMMQKSLMQSVTFQLLMVISTLCLLGFLSMIYRKFKWEKMNNHLVLDIGDEGINAL